MNKKDSQPDFTGLPQDIIDWIKTEAKEAIPDQNRDDYKEAGEAYQIENSWVGDFRNERIKGAIAMWRKLNSQSPSA